jgi:hypothetical protein
VAIEIKNWSLRPAAVPPRLINTQTAPRSDCGSRDPFGAGNRPSVRQVSPSASRRRARARAARRCSIQTARKGRTRRSGPGSAGRTAFGSLRGHPIASAASLPASTPPRERRPARQNPSFLIDGAPERMDRRTIFLANGTSSVRSCTN